MDEPEQLPNLLMHKQLPAPKKQKKKKERFRERNVTPNIFLKKIIIVLEIEHETH